MRKLLPMLFCGVAAVSFSAFAQTSSSSDNATRNPNAQGRSVDTGGARPDSSKATGTVPQTSPAPSATTGSATTGSATTDAAAGSSADTKANKRKARRDRSDASRGASGSGDEAARKHTREGNTTGIGGGTTTTGSGATTATPGSTGGPSSGGGSN